jgi:hypothetical protein
MHRGQVFICGEDDEPAVQELLRRSNAALLKAVGQ